MFRYFQAALCMIVLATALHAQQDARGTVSGHVIDTTGANIAVADVKVTNVATGEDIAIKTNETGNYTVPFLIPGMYTISVESRDSANFSGRTYRYVWVISLP